VLPAIRHLRRRPALIGAAALALVIGVVLLRFLHATAALAVGWCVGVAVYGAAALRLVLPTSTNVRRRPPEQLDEGSGAILAATMSAAVLSLVAIFGQLAAAKGTPHAGAAAILAAVTVLLSWGFVHLIFAQHYAHEFYGGDCGLDFPGTEEPDYGDFLYFSFVIGMTFQVSDVATRSPATRRLVLIHSLLSFLFNTAILALGINLVAGLAG
jgi:uncharacterized membrane protein